MPCYTKKFRLEASKPRVTWLYMLRPLTQGTCAEHQVARAESTGPGIGHHDAHRAMDAVDGSRASRPGRCAQPYTGVFMPGRLPGCHVSEGIRGAAREPLAGGDSLLQDARARVLWPPLTAPGGVPEHG